MPLILHPASLKNHQTLKNLAASFPSGWTHFCYEPQYVPVILNIELTLIAHRTGCYPSSHSKAQPAQKSTTYTFKLRIKYGSTPALCAASSEPLSAEYEHVQWTIDFQNPTLSYPTLAGTEIGKGQLWCVALHNTNRHKEAFPSQLCSICSKSSGPQTGRSPHNLGLLLHGSIHANYTVLIISSLPDQNTLPQTCAVWWVLRPSKVSIWSVEHSRSFPLPLNSTGAPFQMQVFPRYETMM